MKTILNFAAVIGIAISLGGCATRDEPAPIDSLDGFTPSTQTAYSEPSMNQQSAATYADGAQASEQQTNEKAPQLVMKPQWKYEQQKPKAAPKKVQHAQTKEVSSTKKHVVRQKPEHHYTRTTKAKPKTHHVAKRPAPKTVVKHQVAKRKPAPKVVSKPKSLAINTPVQGKIKSSTASNLQILARSGESVKAAKAGTVIYTGPSIKGTGQMVIVKHDDGILSAYSHLGKVSVKEGQVIAKGKSLGSVSSRSGQQTIAFQVRKNGDPINPRKWLGV